MVKLGLWAADCFLMQDQSAIEPTLPERARTLLAASPHAALACVDIDGRPVVGITPIVDDGTGAPVTVISNLSTHVIRARQDSRASMTIGDRLLIQGDLVAIPGLQQLELQERFLQDHAHLQTQVESLDYSWLRLVPLRVCWTDETGSEHWLRPQDLAGAEPDPLAKLADDLVISIADRLGEDLLLMAKTLGGRWLASKAELVQIDRYGLLAMVKDPSGRRLARLPFPDRLDEPNDVHLAVGGLLRAARSAPSDSNSSPSLLHAVESNSGGGTNIDGVNGSGHGNTNSLFDSLESANGQSWSLSSEEDGDPLVWIEDEVPQVNGGVPGGEGEGLEPLLFDDVEPGWERVEASVGEGEGLAHADSGASPVEGITAAGVQQEGIDAESGSAAQDDTHIGGVVDGLGHDDGADRVVAENL